MTRAAGLGERLSQQRNGFPLVRQRAREERGDDAFDDLFREVRTNDAPTWGHWEPSFCIVSVCRLRRLRKNE